MSSNTYLYKHPLFRKDDPDRCKEISGSNKRGMSPVSGVKQLPKDVAHALVKPFPAPSPASGAAAWPTPVVGRPAPGSPTHWPIHSNRFANLTSPNAGQNRQLVTLQNASSFAAQRTAETGSLWLQQPANRAFAATPQSNRFATQLQELELERLLDNQLYARSLAIRQSRNTVAAPLLADQHFAEQRLTPAMAAAALRRVERAHYRRAVSETAPTERRLMTNGLETSLSSSNPPRLAALSESSMSTSSRLATSLPNLWTASARAHFLSSAFQDRTPAPPVGTLSGLSLHQHDTSQQEIGLLREELMWQVFLRRQRESRVSR